MSFDPQVVQQVAAPVSSQSLSSRAMSFDVDYNKYPEDKYTSQSLSSRAMSFDLKQQLEQVEQAVSIPFEQGDVFRQYLLWKLAAIWECLNPFRAGRCLSTIPHLITSLFHCLSQSLSSRAMSFDRDGGQNGH